MTIRERLPNRRSCESFEFRHAGLAFTLCAGSYPDGRIAEIFLSSHKPGSPVEAIARDVAVTVSIALQFGADLETIHAALTRDHDGGSASKGCSLCRGWPVMSCRCHAFQRVGFFRRQADEVFSRDRKARPQAERRTAPRQA